jgi:signal transduction histidine kinase
MFKPMARTLTPGLRPWRAVGLAAAVGGVVTLVSLVPLDSVAYHSPTLHVAIETGATFVALLCAVLMLGRYFREPTTSDLVLAGALLLLGLTNLCFSVIPWVADDQLGSFDTWAPVFGRLIGAGGLAVGAWIEGGTIRNPRRTAAHMLAVVAGTLLVVGLGAAALAPHLPVGMDPNLPPNPSGPELVGAPGLLVCQVISALLYTFAAFGFASRAERTGDELMTWFAAASTAAAFSRLNYFLFPSANSEWVYTGDILRFLFYALILVGAIREIAAYQDQLAEVAVGRARRRIARDLHDGLAQELSFIMHQAQRLVASDGVAAAHIAAAAARALDESRQAIAMLARPADASLEASVSQAAEEVAVRDGVRLRLDLAPGLRAPDAVHDALMRIVREAMTNAIRHGRAGSVTITLADDHGVRLTVEDDGSGLAEGKPAGGGFGLVSMRERAEALGGTAELSGGRQGGARLEVWLP